MVSATRDEWWAVARGPTESCPLELESGECIVIKVRSSRDCVMKQADSFGMQSSFALFEAFCVPTDLQQSLNFLKINPSYFKTLYCWYYGNRVCFLGT